MGKVESVDNLLIHSAFKIAVCLEHISVSVTAVNFGAF